MKLAIVLTVLAIARANAEPPKAAGDDKTNEDFVDVYRKLARVAIDNKTDCSRMAKVMGLVYDSNKDVVERAQRLAADDRSSYNAGIELAKVVNHLTAAVAEHCGRDAAVSAALAKFAAPTPAHPGLDDKMVKRFIAVSHAVTEAVVANAPDCKKAAAAVNKILDANDDLVAAMRSQWSSRTSLQVADSVAADIRKVKPAMQTCEPSRELHTALQRLSTDPAGTDPAPSLGADDVQLKRFVALYDQVTDAVIANAGECKKIAAAVNKLLDANGPVLAEVQRRGSARLPDAVTAHIDANLKKLASPLQTCRKDPDVKAAFQRFAIR